MLKSFLFAFPLLFTAFVHADPPFGPAFHGVGAVELRDNKDYYPSQGLNLQTISIFFEGINGGGIKYAGSFDSRAPVDSRRRDINRTSRELHPRGLPIVED